MRGLEEVEARIPLESARDEDDSLPSVEKRELLADLPQPVDEVADARPLGLDVLSDLPPRVGHEARVADGRRL